MIMMTNIAEIHGPRPRTESVVPAAGWLGYVNAWKQFPSRRAFGTAGLVPNTSDNCTGVSAQERRHR